MCHVSKEDCSHSFLTFQVFLSLYTWEDWKAALKAKSAAKLFMDLNSYKIKSHIKNNINNPN